MFTTGTAMTVKLADPEPLPALLLQLRP
jgi:hypothetical protein